MPSPRSPVRLPPALEAAVQAPSRTAGTPLGDTQGRGRLVQSNDIAVSAIGDVLEGTSAVRYGSAAPWAKGGAQ